MTHKRKKRRYTLSKFKTFALQKIPLRKTKASLGLGENICHCTTDKKKKNLYTEYIKNSYNAVIRKQTTQLENGGEIFK